MLKHFADPTGPGFFFTADDHEQLIARTKDLHDGSTPSGNAMAVTVLLRLAKLLDRRDFAAKAEETLRGYRETMAEHPAASGQMLIALDFHLGPDDGGRGDRRHRRRRNAAGDRRRSTAPSGRIRCVAFHDPSTGQPPRSSRCLKDKPAVDGKVTVYVCENFACQAPLVGAAAVEEQYS